MDKPFDPSKPVQTRDGRPARVLAVGLKNIDYPIVAAWVTLSGQETAGIFTLDGRFRLDHSSGHPNDLINIPVRRTGWIGISLTTVPGRVADASHVYETKDACEASVAFHGFTTIIQIEWDEP